MAKHFSTLLFFLLMAFGATAQTGDTLRHRQLLDQLSRFSLSGYGAMNYYHFDWQTDTAKRDAIDNERFILDLGYKWTDKIRFNSEIEFEHGGTGVAVEFDRFEEFGEFEYEVDKGGEVLIEQMNLEFQPLSWLNIKAGRVKVPFGLMFNRDEPTDYLTCVNSEIETQILPENWTENGFLVSGKAGRRKRWQYDLALVNGLDGSAFNSANWIKRGNQRRFEMANAENFALCGRLDYRPNDDFRLGFSLYGGNTTNNRPKPDLRVSTVLTLGEVHAHYTKNPLNLSAMLFYGALSNSEALTNQNRNLSNNLNVKRTPVGASALGAFAEAGLVLIGGNGVLRNHPGAELLVYGRYDYYDTMNSTEGIVFNNPRWERQSVSVGTVLKIIDDVQIKVQYTLRKVGAPAPTSINGGRSENTFVCGFAFEF